MRHDARLVRRPAGHPTRINQVLRIWQEAATKRERELSLKTALTKKRAAKRAAAKRAAPAKKTRMTWL
jgi:hypothetical protein